MDATFQLQVQQALPTVGSRAPSARNGVASAVMRPERDKDVLLLAGKENARHERPGAT